MTHPLAWIAAARGRIRALLRRASVERELSEEIALHLEMETELNERRGMTPAEARRAAMIAFGGIQRTREEHRDARGTRFFEDVIADLRYAARWLRRTPAFTLSAVLTLALGIGVNAAIFSVVDAVVIRPLPYFKPAELVSLGMGSPGEFVSLRERLRSFSQLGLWVTQTHPVDVGTEAMRLEGAAVTANMLSLLGVSPILGRDFRVDEGDVGRNGVLLISHGLWQRLYGGSPDVIGRRVLVEGLPSTIVGVMPPDFHFPSRSVEYWQPYTIDRSNLGRYWAVGGKSFIGRTAPGVSLAQAQREVREVWPTLRKLNPIWDPGPDYRRDVTPRGLQAEVVGTTGTLLWILFGCVLVVLLICCVNVANLLLARATARAREMAVRAALGGGRGRLVRQLVTESVLISIVGATLGILLAFYSLRWLVAAMPPGLPRAQEISVNGAVFAFTAVVALLTGLLFGIIPALRATAPRSAPGAAGGTRATHSAAHHRVAARLVAGEIALAVLLVIGATLLVRSFNALRQVEPGFETTRILAARITPPESSYTDPARTAGFYATVMDRMSGLAGVRRVAAIDKLPLAEQTWGIATRIQGQYEDATHVLPWADHLVMVTPDYFSTLGIPVRRGRAFTDGDDANAPPVAIVSESYANRYWPSGDAIGRRIGYPYDSPWLTIVGVVADVKQDSLRDTASSAMYVPWRQRRLGSGDEMWLLARTSGDPASLATALRSVVREVDRSVPVSDVRTMDTVLIDSMERARFTVLLVGAFALASLLLGAIGIYGVMSYLVGQRTHEIGVRVALGAPVAGLLTLVVGRAAQLAAAGAVIGVLAALPATRLLGSLLYGVSANDPLSFALVPVIFIAVAVAASALPAVRATRVDPVAALRAE